MADSNKRTRDSKTGRFVPDGTERKRPATTERETISRPTPKKPKGK
jgi:hypothetical protein